MHHLPLAVSASSAFIIAALVAHVLWKFKQSAAHGAQKFYEDDDGTATEESQQVYSRTIRIVKFFLTTTWIIGFIVSISASALNASNAITLTFLDWITFASWVSRCKVAVKYTSAEPIEFTDLSTSSCTGPSS